jgi:hypothetical protein
MVTLIDNRRRSPAPLRSPAPPRVGWRKRMLDSAAAVA